MFVISKNSLERFNAVSTARLFFIYFALTNI